MSSAPVPRLFALIPCGGVGSRAGEGLPKQYRQIAGKSLVGHTLSAFEKVSRISQTLIVIAPEDACFEAQVKLPNATFIVANQAGSMRVNTVLNGLNRLLELGADARDWVLVHDAARCLVTPEQVNALIEACLSDAVGGLLALKLPDTLKAEHKGRADRTVDRADKWLAQTPQMFRIGVLLEALQAAQARGDSVTDEASAMEMMGAKPLLVAGSAQNLKVTYPEDFALAEAILNSRKNLQS